MKRECPKPFRWGVATLLAATLTLTAMCASAQGIKDFLSNAFGSHMNDVAEKIAELPDPTSGLVNVNPAFSADGSVLAVVDPYHKIHLWDWKHQRVLRAVNTENAGGPELVTDALQFSPDGRLLAAYVGAGGNVSVRVWNTTTWEVTHEVTGPFSGWSAIRFNADSSLLLRLVKFVPKAADSLFAYSPDSWQVLWSLHDNRITAQTLEVSPTGNLAAIGGFHWVSSSDGDFAKDKRVPEVALLDLQQRRVIRIISPALALPTNIESMSWSPDGTRLAVRESFDFEVYDPRSGERLAHQRLSDSGSGSIRYSSNGRYLVINGFNGALGVKPGFGVQIWDGQAHKLLQTISGDTAGIAISPDGRYLAVAKRGRIEIWQFK